MPAGFYLLALAFPSGAFALAAGKGYGLLASLLLLYYAAPLLWYGVGAVFPLGELPWARRFAPYLRTGGLPLLALTLPYAPYWLLAGSLRAGLGKAYAAFLRGPGVGLPLTVLFLWPLGYALPPFFSSLILFMGILLSERVWKRLAAARL